MKITDKYINPLTDFGFKKLFGTEPNKDLLIDFLNEILSDRKVANLTYAPSNKYGKSVLDRNAIFDIHCVGKDGERFIVEMQKAKQDYFKDRSVFYASFPIQEQAVKGSDWNFQLEPVYSIGILDFVFDDHKNQEELLHVVELKDQNCEVFYKKLRFIYIELPKFKKDLDKLKTHFDKWLYVFTHLSKLKERPQQLQERIFKKLFKAAEIAQFSSKERVAYEQSLMRYRDIKNVADTAFGDGKEFGDEEATKRIAKAMKEEGEPIEKIVKFTGLSKKEIENL